MPEGIAVAVALRFVEAVNAHDVDRIAALMTANHAFVDSLGRRMEGRETMKQGWAGYFAMCPDYWLRIDESFAKEDSVVMIGSAGGTIRGHSWSTPAALKAIVENRAVRLWQVFADNKPVYDILENA